MTLMENLEMAITALTSAYRMVHDAPSFVRDDVKIALDLVRDAKQHSSDQAIRDAQRREREGRL